MSATTQGRLNVILTSENLTCGKCRAPVMQLVNNLCADCSPNPEVGFTTSEDGGW